MNRNSYHFLIKALRQSLPGMVMLFGLLSCDMTTPEQNFMRATLNCNLMYGFAGDDMDRDIVQPATANKDGQYGNLNIPKRTEFVEQKIAMLEENLKKVEALHQSTDTKEMIGKSAELYRFVLPVYKKEYLQLAALCDAGASAEDILTKEKQINSLYEEKFLALYDAVWTAGKAYAERHNIPVKEVNPSPSR